MNTVKVRDIEIGAGAPKIIVPIVGVTKNDIIEEAKTFHSIPVDVVEWRVDWYEDIFDFEKVEETAKQLREECGIDKKANLRDYFTAEELEKVQSIEMIISGLVNCGWGYNEIKEFITNPARKLIAA